MQTNTINIFWIQQTAANVSNVKLEILKIV